MSELLKIPTISFEDPELVEYKHVQAVYDYIKVNFPEFWNTMEKTPVGNYSMIFKWSAKNPSKDLLPILLLAHLDVVPPGEGNWTYPPFSGHITETEIWGRGALDDKQMMLGAVVGVTHLLAQGWEPTRDIYITFGFDEEVSGFKGACAVAEHFRKQPDLKFEFIHDEGMPILLGIVPGIDAPVAPVGLAEKGALDLEVSITGTAGHSSIPPRHTLIGLLAQGIAAMEANPMPSHFASISRLLMEHLSPDMTGALRYVFSNLWLFKPLVTKIFESKPSTNAIVATTTAVTIVRGGEKRNVLPNTASVHLNFRISPLDSVRAVVEHVERIFLAIDTRFSFKILDSLEPAPISDPYSHAFSVFSKAVRTTFPDTLVTPGVMVGNTDTRHFWGLTENIFRFAPNTLTQAEVDLLHNANERISKANMMKVINFYYQLIMQFTSH